MTARHTRPRPQRRPASPCIVLPWAVADGARNMAVDEAMLELAADGSTLLRFYGWEPWCLSLGRHQAAPDRLLGRAPDDLRPGVDAVRRPTGGRSVFHGPEITYAFACPARAWGGPRAVLQTVHRALGEGLRSLGVPLDTVGGDAAEASLAEASRISAASCFRDPAPGELTARGRKLVGSAQCRRRGGVLQHGSILLDDRQRLGDLDGGDVGPDEGAVAGVSGKGPAIGLNELLDPAPDPRLIVERLADRVAGAFGAPGPAATGASAGTATSPALIRLAARYEHIHRSRAWLWLRERPCATA
ncbi:lipoyl protein ligase domain-containing protein [Candidatus Palauibacter sp.]|uniref:lipoyl protein ligase domain-containing protein n=1 Tax=Candidatus Palauibacter sp. TaxID=3101350 RepID=UPI003B51D318